MNHEITVPRLGWSMEQGVFLGWLKRDGDAVRAGDALYTLEGDKSAQDIEAVESGILRIDSSGPKEGDTVAVGAVLGHLVASGHEGPAVSAQTPAVPTTPAQAPIVHATATAVPAAEVARPAGSIPITPRARRTAKRMGVNPHEAVGTGRGGRIRERDVLGLGAKSEATPLSPRRQAIAEHMRHSRSHTSPVTLTTTVDATNLVNLREQFKTSGGGVPTVTDLFVKLAARALQQHPQLNARWEDDRVVTPADVHIGIAVDTADGLLVPVIRDVGKKSLQQIAMETRASVDKARARRLSGEDMHGGTFTITNLGSLGIDAFTPIINWPQAAILGLGRIHPQPAVVDNQIVVRAQMTLSLTFDHGLVDGAPAARFLQTLSKGVENPAPWLID